MMKRDWMGRAVVLTLAGLMTGCFGLFANLDDLEYHEDAGLDEPDAARDAELDAEPDAEFDADPDTDVGQDTDAGCQGCVVDEICYEEGEESPAGPCLFCDSNRDENGFSPRVDGTTCGFGVCDLGACECEDGWAGRGCESCVVYVDGESDPDDPDGLSWDQAFESVQDGLDRASERLEDDASDSEYCEVWVKEGTYQPGNQGDVESRFVLPDDVHLLGGFSGEESLREERNIEENQTILSGTLGGGTNSYTVVDATSVTGAVVDGVTISGGSAMEEVDGSCTGSDRQQRCGGGVFVGGGSSLTLRDVVITDNVARLGGGLYANAPGNLVLERVLLSENQATSFGGALMIEGGGTVSVLSSQFEENIAGRGGAAHFRSGGSPQIENSEFLGNTAFAGGAIFVTDSVELEDRGSLFEDNEAQEDGGSGGGAIYIEESAAEFVETRFVANQAREGSGQATDPEGPGGGAIFAINSELDIQGAFFDQNQSQRHGGAIKIDGGSLVLLGSEFSRSWARNFGGAIHLYRASLLVERSLFENNLAQADFGGGVAVFSGDGELVLRNTVFRRNTGIGGGGGALVGDASDILGVNLLLEGNSANGGNGSAARLLSSSVLRLINSTVVDNRTDDGNGAFRGISGTTFFLMNTIVWGNRGGAFSQSGGSTNVLSHSIIEGEADGATVWDEDPLFVDEEGDEDGEGKDWRLQDDSPAIERGNPDQDMDVFPVDAGGNPVDLDENPRQVGGRIDLGAFEWSED